MTPRNGWKRIFGSTKLPENLHYRHGPSSTPLAVLTCPQIPHSSRYDVGAFDVLGDRENVVVGAVEKWETRSVFQGGGATVFSIAFLPAHFPRKLLRCPIP